MSMFPVNRVPDILRRMEMNSTQAEAMKTCFGILAIMSREDTNKGLIAKDGMEIVLNVMTSHIDRTDVQEAGCDLLWSLAFNSTVVKEIIAKYNGSTVLVRALKRHSRSSDFLKSACGALSNICQFKQNQESVAAQGGLQPLVGSIHIHQSNGKLLPFIFDAIASIIVNNEDNARGVSALGIIPVVVASLNRHKTVAEVVKSGCHTLAILSDVKGQASKIAFAGGVPVILALLDSHPVYADLHRVAAVVLLRMLQESSHVGKEISGHEGVRILLHSLEKGGAQQDTVAAVTHILYTITNPNSPAFSSIEPQLWIAAPLSSVSADSSEKSALRVQNSSASSGSTALTGVVRILEQYVQRRDVVRAGCRLLTNLTSYPNVTLALDTLFILDRVFECVYIHKDTKDVIEASVVLMKSIYRKKGVGARFKGHSPSVILGVLHVLKVKLHIDEEVVFLTCDLLGGLLGAVDESLGNTSGVCKYIEGRAWESVVLQSLCIALEYIHVQSKDDGGPFGGSGGGNSGFGAEVRALRGYNTNSPSPLSMLSGAGTSGQPKAPSIHSVNTINRIISFTEHLVTYKRLSLDDVHLVHVMEIFEKIRGGFSDSPLPPSPTLGRGNPPSPTHALSPIINAVQDVQNRIQILLKAFAERRSVYGSSTKSTSSHTQKSEEGGVLVGGSMSMSGEEGRGDMGAKVETGGRGVEEAGESSKSFARRGSNATMSGGGANTVNINTNQRSSTNIKKTENEDTLTRPIYLYKGGRLHPSHPLKGGRGGVGSGGCLVQTWPPFLERLCPSPSMSYIRPAPSMLDNINAPNRMHLVYESLKAGNRGLVSRAPTPLPYPTPVSGLGPVFEHSLTFDSEFESGNLYRVIQVSDAQYDLVLRADVHTMGHTQWFYFGVSNTHPPELVKLYDQGVVIPPVRVKFNIINFTKPDSLFNLGMRPVVYSVRESVERGVGWVRSGSDISYFVNNYTRNNNAGEGVGYYYTLSFTMEFTHAKDTVLIAYSYPYTMTDYKAHIEDIMDNHSNTNIIKRLKLCTTLGGEDCDLLVITDFKDKDRVGPISLPSMSEWGGLDDVNANTSNLASGNSAPSSSNPSGMSSAANSGSMSITGSNKLKTKDKQEKYRQGTYKPALFISGRVHPGETPASWMMKGILDFLISSSPSATMLRKLYVIFIVPVLNPDGVICGNNRCSLAGVDLNRQWRTPDKSLHPTIYHLKVFMTLQKKLRDVAMFIDLHGHSRKYNVFMYGCDDKKKPNKTVRNFPKFMSSHNIGGKYVCFEDCSFHVKKGRESTARVVVAKDMSIPLSYTLEATFCGVSMGPLRGAHMNIGHLLEVGGALCDAICKYTLSAGGGGVGGLGEGLGGISSSMRALALGRYEGVIKDGEVVAGGEESNGVEEAEKGGDEEEEAAAVTGGLDKRRDSEDTTGLAEGDGKEEGGGEVGSQAGGADGENDAEGAEEGDAAEESDSDSEAPMRGEEGLCLETNSREHSVQGDGVAGAAAGEDRELVQDGGDITPPLGIAEETRWESVVVEESNTARQAGSVADVDAPGGLNIISKGSRLSRLANRQEEVPTGGSASDTNTSSNNNTTSLPPRASSGGASSSTSSNFNANGTATSGGGFFTHSVGGDAISNMGLSSGGSVVAGGSVYSVGSAAGNSTTLDVVNDGAMEFLFKSKRNSQSRSSKLQSARTNNLSASNRSSVSAQAGDLFVDPTPSTPSSLSLSLTGSKFNATSPTPTPKRATSGKGAAPSHGSPSSRVFSHTSMSSSYEDGAVLLTRSMRMGSGNSNSDASSVQTAPAPLNSLTLPRLSTAGTK